MEIANVIYLDNNSTTRTDARVIEAMIPVMSDLYGNSASYHQFGKVINRSIKAARETIAELIQAEANEIVFTSGATESINIAIKGLAFSRFNNRKKIVTISTEHKAVLDTCLYLESCGFEVVYLPVKKDGIIDQSIYTEIVDENTLLVSAMLVNNETGVIQDIKRLSDFAKNKGAYFFCDATQAVGKIKVDVKELGVDLLCFSGHKFHGPKGIGALYIDCAGKLNERIIPLLHGGRHELGIRSGTLNTPGIIGLAKACSISEGKLIENQTKIRHLRDFLENELLQIKGAKINGSVSARIYNTSNISFPNLDANVTIGKAKNIALSNGSACTALIIEPSHVLKAMGIDDEAAFSAIRFSLSRYNTQEEIINAVQQLKDIFLQSSHFSALS